MANERVASEQVCSVVREGAYEKEYTMQTVYAEVLEDVVDDKK